MPALPVAATSDPVLAGGRTDAQIGKIAQHLALVGRKSIHEGFVVEFSGAIGIAQIAQIAQLAQDHLPPRRRQVLPFRQQRLLNVAALLGRHLRENAFALEQGLPLHRREIVPHLQALPDLRLLLGRQAAETLVVIEEFFLIGGRHLPQLFDPARR